MFRRGIGIDINGDGIPDFRIGRHGIRPDIGMAFMGAPPIYRSYAPYGMPYGMGYGGARIDVDGDGIPDVRVGPFGTVRPDIGTVVHGPMMYPPGYYPTPFY